MKICIVSPHLDDAILSCGILMQRRRALADDILSLNIFTAGTLSETRKQEDRVAMARIGAVPFFLDELDAPDRDPVYKSLQQLFFRPLDPTDAYIAKVERRVRDFLCQNSVDVAYFPLAAGTHIDHRIAHEVGTRMKDTAVQFYEDRPYILWPGILQSRMNQIGSDAALPRVSEQVMTESVELYHYLEHFVPEGRHREETLPLYLAAMNQPSCKRVAARSEELVATDDELRALYECLALYESQMKDIYADYDTFTRDSFRYERTMSGKTAYIERSWTLAF